MILPTDAAERKATPLFSGVLAYFPRALCQVAKISQKGNDQHHPGQPLHWDKSKSTDHLDALARHLLDTLDPAHDPIETLAQVAWRALAELETRLESRETFNATQRNQPPSLASWSRAWRRGVAPPFLTERNEFRDIARYVFDKRRNLMQRLAELSEGMREKFPEDMGPFN